MNRRDVDINYLTYKLEKVYFLLDQFIANHENQIPKETLVALKRAYQADRFVYNQWQQGRHADRPNPEGPDEDPE